MSTIFNKIFNAFHNIPAFGTENQNLRDIWLIKVLSAVPENYRILDAGAGELKYKKYCAHLNYISQDFGQYNGIGNEKGLQTQKWDNSKTDIISDIINIPQPDNFFDVILCSEVLEHIPDPVLAIKEFSRLLKKEGTLIITAPFCSLTHFAPFHFSSGFNRYFYEKHLSDYGFKIKEIVPNGNYFQYLAQEIHRLPKIASIYCNTKLNYLEKLKLLYTLKMLSKLSVSDNGSSELLCFGYHILATKL